MTIEIDSSNLKSKEKYEFYDSLHIIGDIPELVAIYVYGGNIIIEGNVGKNCHIETLQANNIIQKQASMLTNKANNFINAYLPAKASNWVAYIAKSTASASSSIIHSFKSNQEDSCSIVIIGNVEEQTVLIAKMGSINVDQYVGLGCVLKADQSIKIKKSARGSTLIGNNNLHIGSSSQTVAIAKDEKGGVITSGLNVGSLLHAQEAILSPSSFRTKISSPNQENTSGTSK